MLGLTRFLFVTSSRAEAGRSGFVPMRDEQRNITGAGRRVPHVHRTQSFAVLFGGDTADETQERLDAAALDPCLRSESELTHVLIGPTPGASYAAHACTSIIPLAHPHGARAFCGL
jgi:hypothetical protein